MQQGQTAHLGHTPATIDCRTFVSPHGSTPSPHLIRLRSQPASQPDTHTHTFTCGACPRRWALPITPMDLGDIHAACHWTWGCLASRRGLI
jgi:hypothetical protein